MSINWWIGKQNMVTSHNEILFSHKQKCVKAVTWTLKTYSKWKKPDMQGHEFYSIYEKYLE
jgi:hypothetical protein